MLPQTRLVMAGVLTAVMLAGSSRAADLTESLKMGTPDIKSAGPLAFGPDGVLFGHFARLGYIDDLAGLWRDEEDVPLLVAVIIGLISDPFPIR